MRIDKPQITGSIFLNGDTIEDLDSLVTTSSLNSYTGSNNTRLNTIESTTGSLNSYTSSNNTIIGSLQTGTSSLNNYTSSNNTRLSCIEIKTGSYATTGSNTFCGNLTVTGYIDAQELRTTYISSSILYRSGSTKFGDELSDNHSFTGSMLISGSISVPGSNLVSGSAQIDVLSTTNIARLATTGSNIFSGSQIVTGSVCVNGSLSLTTPLSVANGGTGLTTLSANKVMIGNGTTGVLTPSNLHWDNTNSRLGINTTTPRLDIDVANGGINSGATSGYFLGVTSILPNGAAGFYHSDGTTNGNLIVYANLGGIQFNAEGAQAITIKKTSGNVGISETTPTARLHVKGSGVTSGTSALKVDNSGGTNLLTILDNGAATFSSSITASSNIKVTSVSGNQGLTLSNTTPTTGKDWGLNSYDNGNLYFQVSSTNAVYFTPTGAATFSSSVTAAGATFTTGTSNTQLTVNGTGAIKSGINFANGGTTYGQIYFDNNAPYNMSVLQQYTTGGLILGTNNTANLTIANGGNVGIGTASPGYSLEVKGGINSSSPYRAVIAAFKTASYDQYLSITGDGSGTAGGMGIQYGVGTGVPEIFLTSGKVGIGTTSPDYKLDVNGTSRFSGALTGTSVTFTGTALLGGASATNPLSIRTANGESYIRFLNSDGTTYGDFEKSITGSCAVRFTGAYFRVAGTLETQAINAGSALTGTSATFSSSVTAAGFNSYTGTVSAANVTWVTIYTIPSTQAAEGVYYAYGHYNDDSGGMAFTQVLADRSSVRAINSSNGATVLIQLSGRNIQVQHSYGLTVDIQYSILWQKLR